MPLFLSGNSGSATLDSSNGLIYPTWTTAGRPTSPATGQCGYNTSIGGMEIYNGSAWDCITGGPAFNCYGNTNQVISSGVGTKVVINTKTIDTATCFDPTTNYRFTPTVAGYYQINAVVEAYAGGTAMTAYTLSVYKNGSEVLRGSEGTTSVTELYAVAAGMFYMNGSTDYLELYMTVVSSGTITLYGGNAYKTFSGFLARSA